MDVNGNENIISYFEDIYQIIINEQRNNNIKHLKKKIEVFQNKINKDWNSKKPKLKPLKNIIYPFRALVISQLLIGINSNNVILIQTVI